jgi:hypothetical protein
VAVALLTACNWDDTSPTAAPQTPPNILPYVTESAAQSLNAKGEFILAPARAPADLPILTPGRARELAVAEMKTFGHHFRPGYERAHGAPVDLSSLKADPEVLFVETSYERFPDGYIRTERNYFGPYYLVTFRSRGIPVVTSAVSAYAVELDVDETGRLRIGNDAGGNAFATRGIPLDSTQRNPPPRISAEQAVELVGRRTGARTARTPRLAAVRYPGGFTLESPTEALWQLELDREVSVRATKGTRSTRTRALFVRGDRKLLVPAEVQPTVFRVPAFRADANGFPIKPGEQVDLRILAGQPTIFEEVTLDETGR